MSRQDQSASIDEALSAKLPSHLVCPACGVGQMETLRADFTVRPRPTTGVEPIEAIGRMCIRCGFLAMHSVKTLLAKGS